VNDHFWDQAALSVREGLKYPYDRRLGEPQIHFGYGKEEKSLVCAEYCIVVLQLIISCLVTGQPWPLFIIWSLSLSIQENMLSV
jgi:hypothetical protein